LGQHGQRADLVHAEIIARRSGDVEVALQTAPVRSQLRLLGGPALTAIGLSTADHGRGSARPALPLFSDVDRLGDCECVVDRHAKGIRVRCPPWCARRATERRRSDCANAAPASQWRDWA
jgi:hypothetical protein